MKNLKLYSYYFPNWHPDKRNDVWHGKNWTEWEVTKCARPRFENHVQPLVPLWGYEDESDPKVMERKIDAARKYGIDGFIFDTYYYDDGPYREKCLDEGFLKAKNIENFEFAVMWCNHDAIYSHPATRFNIAPTLKSGKVNEEAFVRITNDFIDKYFQHKNYIKVNGKILFGIYNVHKLIAELGGEKECVRVLNDLRVRVREKGLGEIHLATVSAIMEDVFDDKKEINRILNALQIDESLRYWWPVKYKDNRLTVEYKDFMAAGIKATEEDIEVYDIPTVAHVMTGTDQTPRTVQSEIYENLNIYPWYSVVINNTPILFEKAFKEIRKIAMSDRAKGNFMTCVWNEWTEGNFLEPTVAWGYGYLEAIKKVLDEEREQND